MSRVTITEVAGAGVQEREALRKAHQVRLIEPAEEGCGIKDLPNGVYGYSYSPVLAAPLFRTFRYRTYEMHRLADGRAVILGCVSSAEAQALANATGPVVLHIFYDRDADADTMVVIPYDRIRHHRQYSVRNTAGIELTVEPEQGK
ncbi:MAG: hypothetical protein AB7O67_15375 [Vicinamibacterales bacterium]